MGLFYRLWSKTTSPRPHAATSSLASVLDGDDAVIGRSEVSMRRQSERRREKAIWLQGVDSRTTALKHVCQGRGRMRIAEDKLLA